MTEEIKQPKPAKEPKVQQKRPEVTPVKEVTEDTPGVSKTVDGTLVWRG